MIKSFFIAVVALLVGGTGSWLLRGEYEEIFWGNNHFQVINASDKPISGKLVFPSKAEHTVNLKSGQSEVFHVDETGEGSIAVQIGGKVREQVGYVTTMNQMTILAIGEKNTYTTTVSFK